MSEPATNEPLEKNQSYPEIDAFLASLPDRRGALIPVLHHAQETYGYLSREVQLYVARKLGLPAAKVYGVATFYAQFALEPNGDHVIGVCLGTACYVKGAQRVLDRLSELLDVPVGKTTKDEEFTLKATRCLGACGLAPVMMIDEDVYGSLLPEDLPEILQRYRD